MPQIPTLPIAPQGQIPLLGFGTWQLSGDQARDAVHAALDFGYRHIDTAIGYGNHVPVGAGIRASGVPREAIFLTTKVPRENLHYADVIARCEQSLKEIQVDYLDLYLVHWPNNDIPMDETFRAMHDLIDRGRIRACGVSNFTASRLERALALDIVPIGNNQVEYHPFLNQKDLDRLCREQGVTLTAYSPLAQGKVADDPLLQGIARKYGKTPAQVTLRWLLDKEIVAIPKSASRERIASNLDIFDFDLAPEDFEAIDDRQVWDRLIRWDVAEFDR